jgi:hypothetical protein
MHDLAFAMAQNDELLKIVTTTLHDWAGATEMEKARAASFLLGYFKLFENAWFQMQGDARARSMARLRRVSAHCAVPTGRETVVANAANVFRAGLSRICGSLRTAG